MENSTKITAVLSLAATIIAAIVSYGQYKSTEKVEFAKMTIQKTIEKSKLNLELARASHLTKIEMGDFIFQKLELLRDPDKNGMATAMLRFTLEEKEFQDLLTYIAEYGDKLARPIVKDMLEATDKRLLENSLWEGVWRHRFVGTSGKAYEGQMRLKVSLEGTVGGTFTFGGSESFGRIDGRLSEDGTILNGTWENIRGQNGRILFTIKKGGEELSFYGLYSMFKTTIDHNSSNKWSGEKTGDLKTISN